MYAKLFIIFVDLKPTPVLQEFSSRAQHALPGSDVFELNGTQGTTTPSEGKYKKITVGMGEETHC